MNVAKRITLNTFATYSRTILSAGLALFSSRWVLQALGVSDFGIFSLVGSIIVFIVFFNNIMASSASRHFAFELGRNIIGETNKWFNTALSIHVFIPIVLIIIGYPLGIYLIKNIFTIPFEKIQDSIYVLRISMITAYISMISVPFRAMYIAKQKFIELAIIGLIQSLLAFTAAFLLLKIPGNKLIVHTYLYASVQILIYLVLIIRAMLLFSECKIDISQWYHKMRFKELVSFAFWTLFGNFGHLMRTQGLAFLTNLFFGTEGNAAFGVSNQVSIQTSNLTNALSASINPEIIQSVGSGDLKRAVSLSYQSTKLGVYLILLLTIPMFTELNYVLNLWLTVVPPNTAVLCILMIIAFMIEKTTLTHIALLQSVNKISKAQFFQGLIFTFSIPVAFVLIKQGFEIKSIGLSIITTMIISQINLVFWVKKYLNVSIISWLKTIVIPYTIVVVLSLFISNMLANSMNSSFIRLLLNYSVNFIVTSILFWMIFLNKKERSIYFDKMELYIKNILSR